jgi:transcriptional regulator with XRE-family HTH domain
MSEAKTIREIVGSATRARRRELGLTQDALAWRCGLVGFAATRSVIDAIERGTRELELPELLCLLAILGMGLEDLLSGAGQVALSDGISVDAQTLLTQAFGEQPSWEVRRGADSFTVVPATGAVASFGSRASLQGFVRGYSDAEMKAARKLGVDPQSVCEAAETLWDRPLSVERDERVGARASADASPRSLQALRGHVTRALLDELEPEITKPKGARQRGK